MSTDPNEPLRGYGARRSARESRLMEPTRRGPVSMIVGLLLVIGAVAALMVWPRGEDGGSSVIETETVETALGPKLDLRTAERTASSARDGEPDGDIGDLDDDGPLGAIEPPSDLGGDMNGDRGGAQIISVPRDAPDLPRKAPVTPLPELIEDAPEGPLPRVADSGLRPFDAYRVKASTVAATRVAIVIGGLGLSQTGTQGAIEALPPEVTLAFSPDGGSLDRWMREARREGHEVAVQVPMQPLGWPRVNPGRRTLTVGASDNLETLRETLGRAFTYAVATNYLGTVFSTDAGALEPVLRELGERGVGYLDDGRTEASQAPSVVAKLRREGIDVPFGQGQIILDDEREANAVDRKLDELVRIAERRGFAIASGSAFETTVERVALFVQVAKKRGVTVVPLSNLMR